MDRGLALWKVRKRLRRKEATYFKDKDFSKLEFTGTELLEVKPHKKRLCEILLKEVQHVKSSRLFIRLKVKAYEALTLP